MAPLTSSATKTTAKTKFFFFFFFFSSSSYALSSFFTKPPSPDLHVELQQYPQNEQESVRLLTNLCRCSSKIADILQTQASCMKRSGGKTEKGTKRRRGRKTVKNRNKKMCN
jgi:hypothetical protein